MVQTRSHSAARLGQLGGAQSWAMVVCSHVAAGLGMAASSQVGVGFSLWIGCRGCAGCCTGIGEGVVADSIHVLLAYPTL